MKKLLAVILSVLTLMLCLCSCSGKLKTGVYYAEENPETGAQPVVALLEDGVATYSSNRAINGNSRATYTIDEENSLVTVSVRRLNSELVFEIKNKSIIFIADKSTGIEEYNGQPAIKDGDVFKLR